MDESITHLKQQLAEFESFMLTSAYRALVKTISLDIELKKSEIVSRKPITSEDLNILLTLHGELSVLEEHKTIFPTACERLESAILDLEEAAEQQTSQQQ